MIWGGHTDEPGIATNVSGISVAEKTLDHKVDEGQDQGGRHCFREHDQHEDGQGASGAAEGGTHFFFVVQKGTWRVFKGRKLYARI